jgi:hypothetical protein
MEKNPDVKWFEGTYKEKYDKTLLLDARVCLEEQLRQIVYMILDNPKHYTTGHNAKEHPELKDEMDCWNEMHELVQKLAFVYEKQGYFIWKH